VFGIARNGNTWIQSGASAGTSLWIGHSATDYYACGIALENTGRMGLWIDHDPAPGAGGDLPGQAFLVTNRTNTIGRESIGVIGQSDVPHFVVDGDGAVSIGDPSNIARGVGNLSMSGTLRLDSCNNILPANGDIWYDGTVLQARQGNVTAPVVNQILQASPNSEAGALANSLANPQNFYYWT